MEMKREERIVCLGVSRGLGRSFALALNKLDLEQNLEISYLFTSRKKVLLEDLKSQMNLKSAEILLIPADFSKKDQQLHLLQEIVQWNPTRVIYFAGGGPYGDFNKQSWSSHQWAFEVNFLFPSMILHSLLQDQNQADLKQFILVGSSVAESQSDPKASSYSAAKHALWGLYKTVIKENPQIDLRLFSPPYMETEMLPLHSEPRQSGKAWSPEKISSIMLEWIQDCNKTLDHYKF